MAEGSFGFRLDTHDIKYWARKVMDESNNLKPSQLEPVISSFLKDVIDSTPLQSQDNRKRWLDFVRASYGNELYLRMAFGEYAHNVGQLRRCWVMDEDTAKEEYETSSAQMSNAIAIESTRLSEEMSDSNSGGIYSKYTVRLVNSASYFEFRDMNTHRTLAPTKTTWLNPAEQLPTSFFLNSIANEALSEATRILAHNVLKPIVLGRR